MCSRFDLNSNIRAFQVQLGLTLDDIARLGIADFPTEDDATFDGLTGTRRPTDPIAVILPDRKAAIRDWGLSVPGLTTPLINARAETLDQKPTFQPLLMRRCLIPATSWYEWRKDGPAKRKNQITLPDHQPFVFAGLENGHQATIITCAPSGAIGHIHDRMPVVIGPNHFDGWLDCETRFAHNRHMLTALPDHVLSWREEPHTASERRRSDTQISLFSNGDN